MSIEIERKFLVNGTAYRSQAYSHYSILQGYIAHENGRSVRIRITDTEAILTIKGPTDGRGMSRYEWNHVIPMDDARELFALHQSGAVEKVRYLVHSGPHVFEVDEFHGENEGLVMAEVELGHEDEPFVKPDFIGREVTGDHRYYNAYLATNPFSTWSSKD